ncbi:MAG: hypothetical protein GC147_09870 [Porphyrobacter sp.]|nr:hypothetical protein [Porphyrobacter sp.]
MGPNIAGSLDAAMVCVIAFVTFFAGLVWHLRSEDKREGYPLERQGADGRLHYVEGFPAVPAPKYFRRPHDRGIAQAPRAERPDPVVDYDNLPSPGFPIRPGDDPLMQGIGAAAYTRDREDKPDLDVAGEPKIIPLNDSHEYYVPEGDPDPRGWPLYSADNECVGTVDDLWFNRAEFFLRYYEFTLEGEEGKRLAPAFFIETRPKERIVRATTLVAKDLRRVPPRKHTEFISMQEEDRLNGFFAGGIVYSAGAYKDAIAKSRASDFRPLQKS